MAIRKPYDISDKCADCKHCLIEHGIWICLHHKIDVEMFDTEGCDAFEEGVTIPNGYKIEKLKRTIDDLLIIANKMDKKDFNAYYVADELERLSKDKFVFGDLVEE